MIRAARRLVFRQASWSDLEAVRAESAVCVHVHGSYHRIERGGQSPRGDAPALWPNGKLRVIPMVPRSEAKRCCIQEFTMMPGTVSRMRRWTSRSDSPGIRSKSEMVGSVVAGSR